MTRIPKVIHYVFGMARDYGGKPWSLIHHVCLRSAIERIKPAQAFLYYEFEPTGPWWTLSKKLVTPVQITAPLEIFGRPLRHVAHRSDVVRLQKLIEHGGIYLDADVLVQRDFDDLLGHSTVLGREATLDHDRMANAVILSEPNAPFLRRWLGEYRSFRSSGKDEFWNEHSVKLPARLAADYPEELTVLSDKAFFWPLWHKDHLELIFRSDQDVSTVGTYANHLWEAQAWSYLQDLTPGGIRARDTNFNRWARPFIADLADDYGAPSVLGQFAKLQARARTQARRFYAGVKRRLVRLVRKAKKIGMDEDARRRIAFQEVYSGKQWGGDESSKFFSGVGSGGKAMEIYADHMANILRAHADKLGRPLTIVDLGCGDFRVGRALLERLPECSYIGCDIVPELIAHNAKQFGRERVKFMNVDIVAGQLPPGDVCLVRQVLQHLPNADVKRVTKRLNYRYVYVTEGQPAERSGPANPDKKIGANVRFDWRKGIGRGLELDQPPFSLKTQEVFRAFAPPHEVIVTERVFVGEASKYEDCAHRLTIPEHF